MDSRRKVAVDRIAVRKFIYETGKDVAEKIMHSSSSNQYLTICQDIVAKCDQYPDNDYGKPDINDVMCEAYRRINYEFSEVQARAGF